MGDRALEGREPRTETQAAEAPAGNRRERFLPGEVFAGRYRIVAPLARGGMGELYRADDLRLGEPVALKFLADELAARPTARARLLQEVRLARRATHPNVCRVHDVVEAEGQLCLSMEFVDGEDLASLLRRIGRLPVDKGLQLARQICAGLAAAHACGVLHRDLKPSNVMIDGRGVAKITDFGIATTVEDGATARRAGTRGYMAPEQADGREVSVQTDLFALGIVLFEMFTGRAAPRGAAQIVVDVPAPSTLVEGLPPELDAVVQRCLDPLPSNRPVSAAAVAAALPGRDPLDALVSAGETPQPELVAVATGGVHPRTGTTVLLLVTIACGLVAAAFLGRRALAPGLAGLEKPPQVLAERAQTLARELRLTPPAARPSAGLHFEVEALRWAEQAWKGPERWQPFASARPALLTYWQRWGPRPLIPTVPLVRAAEEQLGRVTLYDPPPFEPGAVTMQLDPRGRLLALLAPPAREDDEVPAVAAGGTWDALFAAAGLDRALFREAAPRGSPPVHCDERAAWAGELPELPGVAVHVEACLASTRPAYFRVAFPWTRDPGRNPWLEVGSLRAAATVQFVFYWLALAGAAWLARRNLRLGRGDRRGATRLALFSFGVYLLAWGLVGERGGGLYELSWALILVLAQSAYYAATIWLFYIGFEPYARRRWPRLLATWNRLLAGSWADPAVGRDVLVGIAAGVGLGVLALATRNVHGWLGEDAARPLGVPLEALLGFREAIGHTLLPVPLGLITALSTICLIVLFELLLRRRAAALAAYFFVSLLIGSLYGGDPTIAGVVLAAASTTLLMATLLRAGLLAAAAAFATRRCLEILPLPLADDAWYTQSGWVPLLLLTVLALAGFAAARRGERARA